jgi:hypothetical protein
MRRASRTAVDQEPFSLLLRFPILRFAADSDLFELANDFSSLSQSIAFVQRRLTRVRRERVHIPFRPRQSPADRA